MIRSAQKTEMIEIYMMGFDVWSESITEDEYLQSCRESKKYSQGSWKVLEKDGALVSSLITYKLKSDWIGIGSIATPTKLRCRGFSAELITGIIDNLKSLSTVSTIFLFSDINPSYYHRFGFCALEDKHQTKKNTVLMGLSLKGTPAWLAQDFFPPTYF